MKNGMFYVRKQYMFDYKKKLSFLKYVLIYKFFFQGDEVLLKKKNENLSLVFGVFLLILFYLCFYDDIVSMVVKEL